MHMTLIAVGRMRPGPVRDLYDHYAGRLGHGGAARACVLDDGDRRRLELGHLNTAIDMACEMSRTPRRLQYVRARRPLFERLMARGSAAVAQAIFSEAEQRLQARVDFR
ncbi:MAG: hypothetical protein IH924_09150 [Proteobacteria bacterium]|nr:hypothetical protein [Pseudomonadota bacterium]